MFNNINTMKIAFISAPDPTDKNSRSGVPYSIYNKLAEENEVVWVNPEPKDWWVKILIALIQLVISIFRAFKVNLYRIPLHSRLICYGVQIQLDAMEYDCIFTMGSFQIAYLKVDKPIFCRTDAVVHTFIDYYVFGVPDFAKKWAYEIEERALHKYTKFFIPSQWILDSIHQFKVNEPDSKFPLIETGANIDPDFIHPQKHIYGMDKPLNMLFVGYNIMRKGFDVAYDTVNILNNKYDVKATLTVMGGKPDEKYLKNGHVRYVGKKSKNDPKQYQEFYDEFAAGDLFIFPTRAECHGIVNCEAAAYALPIFSYNTGGVSNYCIDGVNGRCLPIFATGDDYATAIVEAIKSGKMADFSKNSRHLYEEKFNWDAWYKKAYPIMKECVYGLI